MDEAVLEHQEILRAKRVSCTQPSVHRHDCLLLKCDSSVEYE